MLYQERVLGRRSLWSRIATAFSGRRSADLDLLSMNRHLRRDVGLDEGQGGLRADRWRK